MTCRRSPVPSADVPTCWGFYRGDADCASCGVHATCRRYARLVARLVTVREAAEEAWAEASGGTARAAATAAYETWVRLGGRRTVCWWRWKRHRVAFERMAAACAACGVDARVYAIAQVEVLGPVAIARGQVALAAGCFVGRNADQRFARWLSARRGRATLCRQLVDVRRQELEKAAASAFGVAYLADGATLADAEAAASELLAFWRVDERAERERLWALASGLDAVAAHLSERVLIREGDWSFASARAFVERLAEAARRASASLDDSLGVVL